MSKVTPADVESLIELFDGSEWKELHLEIEGFEIHLSKDPARRMDALPTSASSLHGGGDGAARPAAGSAPPVKAGAAAAASVHPDWVAIRAPNLGTFYRSPKPGAPAFVEVGQAVTAETELCLIEVMKLFTALRAGVAGTLRQVCVSDAELIEHDQVLFYIEPDR